MNINFLLKMCVKEEPEYCELCTKYSTHDQLCDIINYMPEVAT